VEAKPAPAPVVEAKPTPAPVVEAKPAPAPVIEAKPAPAPVVAKPAPPPVAPSPPAPPPPMSDEQAEIWSLLQTGKLDAAKARVSRLIAADPEAAWPRFARGEFYFQRFWRRDCIEDWELALAREPSLRRDPRFTERLCLMLDDKWQSAGVNRLLDLLGADAAPLLRQCEAAAKKPALRALAARALQRLGG
jgi:hypothetical protein